MKLTRREALATPGPNTIVAVVHLRAHGAAERSPLSIAG